jgi:DNA (cytosine-5)-methyltransferase 1
VEQAPIHVDLFSGIGGFALAARWAGFRTVAFCEIDKYCQKVLAKNFMADATSARCSEAGQYNGGLPLPTARSGERSRRTPSLHGNIFDFDGTKYRGCDLITGGFPCQPFSVAGKRRGAADDRAIWPEMFRIIDQARPTWVLGENVPGIIPMELDNVLSDLEGIGYACRAFTIPACAVDARHRRDRIWIVGHDTNSGYVDGTSRTWPPRSVEQSTPYNGERLCWWLPEPNVGRVAHGIPSRVDRLKGLGNAIVPQVAYEILREIRKMI